SIEKTDTPAAKSAPLATASVDKADPPAAKPTPPSGNARIAAAWSSKTEVHANPAPAPMPAAAPPRASAPAHEARAPLPEKADGKYRVQLAAVRSQQEAVALAAKAKRALAGALPREPEIDEAVLGNMGSFYRVRVGPYATAQEAQAVCAKIK